MSTERLPAERGQRLPARRGNSDAVIGAFESETQAVIFNTSPKREHTVLYVFTFMIVLMITLASVAKLDRVVTGKGLMVPTAGSLYVSPLQPGIVRKINVKVGDTVRRGEVLATLDPTFTTADVTQLREKLASDTAEVARLRAEHDDAPYQPQDNSPDSQLQTAIWQQRQAEYHSTLAGFDAQVAGARATVSQYSQDLVQYHKRLDLADKVKGMYQPLVQQGYVSQLQWVSANDSREEVSRLVSDAQHQIASSSQTIANGEAQRRTYIEKWHGDTGKELVTAQNDLDQTQQSLRKAEKSSEMVNLTAPADAVVLRIGKVSQGSTAGTVADSGQEALFTLTPLDAPVEAEIHVAARDVGFITPGQKVQIKLDAYRYTMHGTGKGVLRTISDGSFTTDENNVPTEPYFKVRVSITEMHLKNVPADFRVTPGMTMVGDVMVGRRTLLSYIVEGALRTSSEAMREP